MDKQAIAIHILCSHGTETAILSAFWPHLSCTALGLGSTVFYVPVIQQLFWLGFHYVWNNMRHSGLANVVFLWHEDISGSQDPCIVPEDCLEGREISRVQSNTILESRPCELFPEVHLFFFYISLIGHFETETGSWHIIQWWWQLKRWTSLPAFFYLTNYWDFMSVVCATHILNKHQNALTSSTAKMKGY